MSRRWSPHMGARCRHRARRARGSRRRGGLCIVEDTDGRSEVFTDVVIGAHADEALALLAEPTADERRAARRLPLHRQRRGAPRRPRADAEAPVGLGELELHRRHATPSAERPLCVSYWMNYLQTLPTKRQLFVTLNPVARARAGAASSRPSTTPIRCSMPARSRRRTSSGACRARATPGSAAAISATASTRMRCSPASPSPRRWARRRPGPPRRRASPRRRVLEAAE